MHHRTNGCTAQWSKNAHYFPTHTSAGGRHAPYPILRQILSLIDSFIIHYYQPLPFFTCYKRVERPAICLQQPQHRPQKIGETSHNEGLLLLHHCCHPHNVFTVCSGIICSCSTIWLYNSASTTTTSGTIYRCASFIPR